MEITFDIPHAFYRGASHLDNAFALRAMLDCQISLNSGYLQTQVLRGRPVVDLYRSGVRYGRTKIWYAIPGLYKLRYGDCKSLTGALIAQYRFAGIPCDPVFRWVLNKQNGENDFHILILRLDTGKWEDPSKALGMGKDENARFYGPESF